MARLIYEKLTPEALAPTKAYPEDAGFDLRSIKYCSISPGEVVTIPTGLAIKMDGPKIGGMTWYWRVADKSGLASKGIHVLSGVVDRNFRGEVGVVLTNLGSQHWVVEPGDKICQILPEMLWDVREAIPGTMEETDRGSNGFGSSGK